MEHSNEHTEKGAESNGEVSRRGFLAGSSTILLGQDQGLYGSSLSPRGAPSEPRNVVLGRDDLVAPDEGTYTEIAVDTEDASLVQALRDTDAAFGQRRAVTGFMATTNHDTVPLSIESAALDIRNEDTTREFFDAVVTWVQTRHVTSDKVESVDIERGADTIQWNIFTCDDWLNVMRILRVDEIALFTVVFGDLGAKIDPRTALERYAEVMREKVTRR